jgi:hypothetical protein
MSTLKPLHENTSFPADQLERHGYNAVPHHVPPPQPPTDGNGSQNGDQGNAPLPEPNNQK